MRWQQLIAFSLVTVIGLIGCARQGKSNLDLDKGGDVAPVAYDPAKELNESYGVRAASGSSARGVLEGTSSYWGTDSVLVQLMNQLQPYSQVVNHVAGVTLSMDSFNSFYSQYCQYDPAYCYSNGSQTPVDVEFTVAVTGGTSKLYRVYIAQNSYAGISARYYGYYGGQSYATAWDLGTNQTNTVFKARLFAGSNISFYQAVGAGVTSMTVTMKATPIGGTANSGSKNTSGLLSQSASLPSYYASQVNVDSLSVTASNSPVTASIKVGKLATQQLCYWWSCLAAQ